MKRYGTFTIALAALMSLFLPHGVMGAEKKAPTKTVVVLCDLSESTRKFRDIYIESVKNIVASISHGDALVIAKITDASISESTMPVKEEFPAFVPKDKMGNVSDNLLLVRSAKKEADTKLQQKKEEIEKTFRQFLTESSDAKRRVMHTDIFSSLHVAEKSFKSLGRDRSVLVILSDMIEDSRDYNLERENLTDRRVEAIIKSEKAKHRIADLKGVKVHVVAASSLDSNKFFAIQNLWLKYFIETGASLSREDYGSTMLRFAE